MQFKTVLAQLPCSPPSKEQSISNRNPQGMPWMFEGTSRQNPVAAVSQVFQRSGHSPSAPTHHVGLSKLEGDPPPRGFEEFFAKLAADPLVQVHSRNQNSIQFQEKRLGNQRYKISRISDLHDFLFFFFIFCWTPRCRIVNPNGLRNLVQEDWSPNNPRAMGHGSKAKRLWGHSFSIGRSKYLVSCRRSRLVASNFDAIDDGHDCNISCYQFSFLYLGQFESIWSHQAHFWPEDFCLIEICHSFHRSPSRNNSHPKGGMTDIAVGLVVTYKFIYRPFKFNYQKAALWAPSFWYFPAGPFSSLISATHQFLISISSHLLVHLSFSGFLFERKAERKPKKNQKKKVLTTMAAPPWPLFVPNLFFFLVFWRGWIPYSPAPVREALLPFPVCDIFSFFQVLVPSMHPPWREMFLWWEACRTLWLFVRHIECGTQVESGSNWDRMGEPRKVHVMHIYRYTYMQFRVQPGLF